MVSITLSIQRPSPMPLLRSRRDTLPTRQHPFHTATPFPYGNTLPTRQHPSCTATPFLPLRLPFLTQYTQPAPSPKRTHPSPKRTHPSPKRTQSLTRPTRRRHKMRREPADQNTQNRQRLDERLGRGGGLLRVSLFGCGEGLMRGGRGLAS